MRGTGRRRGIPAYNCNSLRAQGKNRWYWKQTSWMCRERHASVFPRKDTCRTASGVQAIFRGSATYPRHARPDAPSPPAVRTQTALAATRQENDGGTGSTYQRQTTRCSRSLPIAVLRPQPIPRWQTPSRMCVCAYASHRRRETAGTTNGPCSMCLPAESTPTQEVRPARVNYRSSIASWSGK